MSAAEQPPAPRSAVVGAILWPSFFAAGIATMVFFALVDPTELQMQMFPEWQIRRELGYTLGFFLFWIACAGASLFTWILLRPADRVNTPHQRG